MITKKTILEQSTADYRPEVVGIDYEAISNLMVPPVVFKLPPTPADQIKSTFGMTSAIAFLIALNSINYCFWSRNDDGTLDRFTYNGKVGAVGMIDAFTKEWGGCDNAFRLRMLGNFVNIEGVKKCFPGISMPESRAEIFAEVLAGTKLEELAEELRNEFDQSKEFTVKSAYLLADTFPKAFYDLYLKKAQLTIMWIASLYGAIQDQIDLTVAADYQLPRVLRGMKILHYSSDLAQVIDNNLYINPNSEFERAIRGATILATEAINQKHNISIPSLDWWLWSERNSHQGNFHLTPTTNY